MLRSRAMMKLAVGVALLCCIGGCGGDKDEPHAAAVTEDAVGAPQVGAAADAAVAAVAQVAADATPSGTGVSFDAASVAPAAAETDKPEKAVAKGPQNLKVLPASWSLERVKKHMKTFNKGLGVDCDHCHKDKNYAADTDHKRIARDMIRMTRALNRQYFGGKGKVTCMTCHHGKPTFE